MCMFLKGTTNEIVNDAKLTLEILLKFTLNINSKDYSDDFNNW